jgi:hypothetical protein
MVYGGDGTPYPTILDRLIDEGHIASHTFSMWSDKLENKTGSILFGGINSKKFRNDSGLLTLSTNASVYGDIWRKEDQTQLVIALQSVSTTKVSQNTTSDMDPVTYPSDAIHIPGSERSFILNTTDEWICPTSTSILSLPGTMAVAVWDAVGAEYEATNNPLLLVSVLPIVPCSFLSNTSATLDLTLGDANGNTFVVSALMSDLVRRNGTGPNFDKGPYASQCILTVSATLPGYPNSIGFQFLKYMYIVTDLSNNEISLGLTDFDTAGDELHSIPAGGVGDLSTTLTQPITSSVSAPSKKSKIPLAVGLGVGLPAALIICGILLLFLWRRRQRDSRHASGDKHDISENEKSESSDKNPERMSELPQDGTKMDPKVELEDTQSPIELGTKSERFDGSPISPQLSGGTLTLMAELSGESKQSEMEGSPVFGRGEEKSRRQA